MQSLQAPIGSSFGAGSTAFEVCEGIDLSGKVAIVTGGSSGIGTETTQALSRAGATVIVPARNREKAAASVGAMPGIEIEDMDLASPLSVDRFAQAFLDSGRKLDILVNSAGIMATPLSRDRRGYEMQFATNHLGHFQLTNALLPALIAAKGARVVSVSSAGHRFSPVIFEDPNFENREYEPFSAYGQSKTANILFAVEADRRWEPEGIRVFAVHPGTIVETGLGKHISQEQLRTAGAIDAQGQAIIDPSRGFKTVEQGASTSVWCAVRPELDGMGGVYCANCDITPVIDPAQMGQSLGPTKPGVLPYAIDRQLARRLWELSESL